MDLTDFVTVLQYCVLHMCAAKTGVLDGVWLMISPMSVIIAVKKKILTWQLDNKPIWETRA